MKELLRSYDPITLAEMKSIKLMNRIDTKFVTTRNVLMQLLDMARDAYWAQEIKEERNLKYDTTYFDTTDYNMFYVHQTGHCGRQKLRFRTYVSSDLQFMEVKTKNNRGRTKKKRMEVTDMDISDKEKSEFLSQYLHYDQEILRPSLRNNFNRITLVNKGKTERLTIDTNLWFQNMVTGKERHMGDLVIVELKRDGLCYSPVLEMLRKLRVFPHGFSKYCIGSALTNDNLRINRFKRKIIEINHLAETARWTTE